MPRLDSFLFLHPELSTMDPEGNLLRLLEDTFTRANAFSRFPIAIPQTTQLMATTHVQTHEKIFDLHVTTTNIPYMMRLTEPERRLFEIILLHKLYCHYDREGAAETERRSRNVLGCMIQNRLSLFLTEIHQEEIGKIFLLGRASGIKQSIWESQFLGAAARARTIATFLEIEDCRLFLPTIFENLSLGVDLIVLQDQKVDWCLAIKSGASGTPLSIEHVHTRPHERNPAFRAADRRRIFDGARDMENMYDGEFLPARVMVGKTNERSYDLTVYKEDVAHVRDFLRRPRAQNMQSDFGNATPRVSSGTAA